LLRLNSYAGQLESNYPLAKFTSWRVGGNAEWYFKPFDLADLINFLQNLPMDMPVFFLGLGSNILFPDLGMPGVVIHSLKGLDSIKLYSADTIYVQAGTPCAKLAKFTIANNLMGGEFFAGIPGTVGGALAMNAGAFGGTTWDQVVSVDVINRQGKIISRSPSEYSIDYRSVVMPYPEEWFVGGVFKFAVSNNSLVGKETVTALLKQRSLSQPIGSWSCGSVFRNPYPYHAAKLIENSKLKGVRIGDAEVSCKHANFIINLGQANAKDIKSLIEHIKTIVLSEHGILLKPEVLIIDDF
jgi:UDP-N-acetylmuramate dehydrogenase